MIPSQSLEYYSCTENYLKGSVVCNARRIAKSAHFLRGIAPHSLRWIAPDSAFLQQVVREQKKNILKHPHDYLYRKAF